MSCGRVIRDCVTHGETYNLEIEAKDASGNAITLDGTWSGVFRVMTEYDGGDQVTGGAVTISGGKALADIDTDASGFKVGTFWVDCRLTDSGGNDYWSQAIKLELSPRQSKPS